MKNIILILLPIALLSQPINFQLISIDFAPGRAKIEETSFPVLDSLAGFLKRTGAKVEIGGYTDNQGTPTQNEELSQQRAQAVCEYLESQQRIPRSQLVARGYGPSKPIATNRTPAGRAKNNRIEITVLSEIPGLRLNYVRGNLQIRKPGISDWSAAMQDQRITAADRIATDSTAQCEVILENGGKLMISPGSEMVFEEIAGKNDTAPASVRIRMDAGRLVAKNYPTPANMVRVAVATPVTTVQCKAADFLLVSQAHDRDLISVWHGKVAWQGPGEYPAVEIPEGYGALAQPGKSPEAARALLPTPVFESVAGYDTLFFEPDKPMPFTLHYTRPGSASVRVILSRDPELYDRIEDHITTEDSLASKTAGSEAIYITLISIDADGLESPPTPASLICLPRKTTGPKLVIIRQSVEKKDNKKVLILEGQTDPLCDLSVNQEKIKIPADGKFSMMIRLKPGTNLITLRATNRWGHSTTLPISLKTGARYEAAVYAGPAYLSGSGYNTSRIGLVFGGYFAFKLQEKLTLAPFVGIGEIRCRTATWEPEGDHYRTKLSLGGLRLKYLLNPLAGIGFHGILEAGAVYWKSYYDKAIRDWSINPYAGIALGLHADVSELMGVVAEVGAGYLRNKAKFNLGRQGTKYLLPTGRLGLTVHF